jgi:hypothetical protein
MPGFRQSSNPAYKLRGRLDIKSHADPLLVGLERQGVMEQG